MLKPQQEPPPPKGPESVVRGPKLPLRQRLMPGRPVREVRERAAEVQQPSLSSLPPQAVWAEQLGAEQSRPAWKRPRKTLLALKWMSTQMHQARVRSGLRRRRVRRSSTRQQASVRAA
jgi:hypothetical protein